MSLRVASFVSGGGTTMDKTFRTAQCGKIPWITPALVVASKPEIWAIKCAYELEIPCEVLQDPKNSAEILRLLYKYDIDVIFQNGYLPRMPSEIVSIYSREFLNPDFINTKEWQKLHDFNEGFGCGIYEWLFSKPQLRYIFNQHPGSVRSDHLDFGGQGMWGSRVTAARVLYLLATWAKWPKVFTESTVQHTHAELDKWILLWVKRLDFPELLHEFRSPSNLSRGTVWLKIHDQAIREKIMEFTGLVKDILLPMEHENVIELLQKVGRGETPEEHPAYRETLVPKAHAPTLAWAKSWAGILFPKG